MRTELQINKKIKEIESDIIKLKNNKCDIRDDVSDVLKIASISAAERQIQLLEWVLKG